jgi:hypothetical protein
MQDFPALIQYVLERPLVTMAVAVGFIGIYCLLNRKSRLTRDTEKRLAELRRERRNYYRHRRPPS